MNGKILTKALAFQVFIASLSVYAADAVTFGDVTAALSNIARVVEQKHMMLATNTPEAAALGLLRSLDPEAAFLEERAAQEFMNDEKGVFVGVGLSFSIKDNWPVVEKVLPDSPAAGTDIKPGERIETIDGARQEGRSLDEVAFVLRGERGAPLVIEVSGAEKGAEPRKITLKREAIQLPVLAAKEVWLDSMVYLQIKNILKGTGQAVEEFVKNRSLTNAAGVIIDLRGAVGADLVSVADIASMYAPEGSVLFRVRDGSGAETAVYKARESRHLGLPTLVLIDNYTAQAAETLAAVLSGFQGVVLVGDSTAGDDRLRELIPMEDGRKLLLGTKRVDITPAPCYRGSGVKPDIAISHASAEKEAALYLRDGEIEGNGIKAELSDKEKQVKALLQRIRGDAVLKRAADLLLGLQALSIKTP